MAFGKQRQAKQPRGVHAIGMKKLSIQNIVMPIDFSDMSIDAIATAKRLAQRFGAAMHLVHVHQFAFPATFIAQQLKTSAERAGLSPWEQTHLRTGAAPFHEICKLAQEVPTDLIVMPTHGYTGLKHVFLGSTAERVVQHSPCPVFVVREQKRRSKTGPLPSIKTILVPVDFSDCSRDGLRYAIGFANEYGARIILLHATYLGYIYSSEGTAIYDVPALQKAACKNAERHMRELVRTVNFGRAKFKTVLTGSSPVLDICAFAKGHDVDLIITSTHGLTGLQHVLIGSIAEQVVRHAPCSVLVVPSHPETRLANLTKRGAREAQTLASSPRRIRRVADQQKPRKSPRDKAFTKRDRKLASHSFPERRQINKFRESHFSP
jgi:nucleotide-binding universal stress UspA family protein